MKRIYFAEWRAESCIKDVFLLKEGNGPNGHTNRRTHRDHRSKTEKIHSHKARLDSCISDGHIL